MLEKAKNKGQIAAGRRIRLMREYKGLTREAFAEIVDLSPQFIADIEYGNKGISVDTLRSLCKALEVTADYILFGKLYDADKEEEAAQICDDIVAMLRPLNMRQLKHFRDIAVVYTESMSKN